MRRWIDAVDSSFATLDAIDEVRLIIGFSDADGLVSVIDDGGKGMDELNEDSDAMAEEDIDGRDFEALASETVAAAASFG
jgi:hypothetical protein